MRRATPTLIALACATAAGVAHAQSGEECIAAAERGQDQRDRGAFLEARASFLTCARDACPTPLRKDCARWLDDVESGLPTVVFGARDAQGHDVEGFRVFVDDAPVEAHDAWRAVPLDPGRHRVRFEMPPSAPYEETVVLRMGEKNRSILATFAPPAPAVAEAPKPTARPLTARVTPWAYVLGGVGVAGLGAFVALGLSGLSEKSHLEATCAPHCTDDQVAPLRARYIGADVALGVSVLSLAAATYLFVEEAKRGPRVSFAPTRGGASAFVTASF